MKNIGMILLFIFIVYVAYIYNLLEKNRNKIKMIYSNMDIKLKKRWDLTLDLVKVVKNFNVIEDEKLEKIVNLTNQDFSQFKMEHKLNIDDNISKVVQKIILIIDNYPELKSNEEYVHLSKQLITIDIEISNIKKEYNKIVKEYNKNIEIIPNNLVAILFGFNEEKC